MNQFKSQIYFLVVFLIDLAFAQNKGCGSANNETCIDVEEGDQGTFSTVTESVSQVTQWLEMDVVAGLRAWQVMFLCIAGLITVTMFFCCVTNGRIPRTKQQIDADYQRKKLAKKFRSQLNKIQVEEMNLAEAIEKLRVEMPDAFLPMNEKSLPEEIRLQNGDAHSGSEDNSDAESNLDDEKPAKRQNLGQILRKALMGIRLTRKNKPIKDEEEEEAIKEA